MPKNPERAFELVVIGAGVAGLSAVEEALRLNVRSVALVDNRATVGGSCLQEACIPAKTLASAIKYLKVLRQQAPSYGMTCSNFQWNLPVLKGKMAQVISEGVSFPFLSDSRVTRLHGAASFVSRRELQVGESVIRGEHIVIATGSEPVIPTIEGLSEAGYMLFHQALQLDPVPSSLIIIGGGFIGVEFAQMFQWLGCQVTLLEMNPCIMRGEEPEICDALAEILQQDGVQLHTTCQVQKVASHLGRKRAFAQKEDRTVCFEAEEILVAIGMRPRVEALQLEHIGVSVEKKGIVVNDELQTTCPGVWAVGDVMEPFHFANAAYYQARLAVRNALKKRREKAQDNALPWAMSTIPAVAHVGYTAEQARQRYAKIVVLIAQAREVARFRIEACPEGLVKIVIDAQTDRIVGCHMLASHAEDIIHLPTLAIQQGLTVWQLADLTCVYPSKSILFTTALATYAEEKQRQTAVKASQASG
jgi:pyruvate/2-oxoglutarate dehydrogenase complex dihydrolipoamide dehydrogenase (E3) component